MHKNLHKFFFGFSFLRTPIDLSFLKNSTSLIMSTLSVLILDLTIYEMVIGLRRTSTLNLFSLRYLISLFIILLDCRFKWA